MKMKDSFPIEIILTQSSMKNNSGDHSQTGLHFLSTGSFHKNINDLVWLNVKDTWVSGEVQMRKEL